MILTDLIEILREVDYSCISVKILQSKILTYCSNCDIETLLVEINLRKRNWLLNCSYNPNKSQTSHHLECLNSLLDEYSKKYENYVFIVNTSDSSMKEFCSLTLS